MATIVKGKNPRKPYTVRHWTGGRQQEKSYATLREARDFKTKVEHDSRAQIFVDPDVKTTVAQYFEEWLPRHPVATGTRRLYRSNFANRIKPEIGDKAIGRVTQEDIRTLLLETMPREVGPSGVQTARKLLTAMFGTAVGSKIVANPAAGIRLPTGDSERAEFTTATHGQLEAITSLLPESWGLAVWIMRGCGLRIGECLAVRADSVRGEELRAEEQVLRMRGRGPLKGRRPGEYRDIPLPRYVASKITDHVEASGAPADGYLFPEFATGEVTVDAFRSAFRRAAKKTDLPDDFSPHDLRHIFASIALHAGIPLTEVSRWLGHRDVNVTHRIYGHMVPSAVGRARGVLDAEYESWSGQ